MKGWEASIRKRPLKSVELNGRSDQATSIVLSATCFEQYVASGIAAI